MRRTEAQITEEIMRRSGEYMKRAKKRRMLALISACAPLAILLLFGCNFLLKLLLPMKSSGDDKSQYQIDIRPETSTSVPVDAEVPTGAPEAEDGGTPCPTETPFVRSVTVSKFVIPEPNGINSGFQIIEPAKLLSLPPADEGIYGNDVCAAAERLLNSAAQFENMPEAPRIYPTSDGSELPDGCIKSGDVGYKFAFCDENGAERSFIIINGMLMTGTGEWKLIPDESFLSELYELISDLF